MTRYYLWLAPPVDPVLSKDELHVWQVPLERPVRHLGELARTLAAEERRRAERLRFDWDRKRFIIGRGLLRTILGRYLSVEPGRLQLCYGPNGKPALAQKPDEDRLHFNVSYSHGLVVYCVTLNQEIGIDVEKIRPIYEADRIAAYFFSPREYAVFRALAPGQKCEAFFNCWTRKEAFVKALGDGLARPLDQFEVSLVPGEPARMLRIADDPEEASKWFLETLTPAPGYAAALAMKGERCQLVCWRWAD